MSLQSSDSISYREADKTHKMLAFKMLLNETPVRAAFKESHGADCDRRGVSHQRRIPEGSN